MAPPVDSPLPAALPAQGCPGAPSAPSGGVLSTVAKSYTILVLAAYPALLWGGANWFTGRDLALVMLALVLPVAVVALWRPSSGGRGMVFGPVVTVLALAVASWSGSTAFLYVEPVAISLGFLLMFGATLRPGSMPMVERFARLQIATLSPAQVAWCRLWTVIWCSFFVASATIATVLAMAAPMSWWVLYTGPLSYVVMGVLFATEWVLRRRRFHRGR